MPAPMMVAAMAAPKANLLMTSLPVSIGGVFAWRDGLANGNLQVCRLVAAATGWRGPQVVSMQQRTHRVSAVADLSQGSAGAGCRGVRNARASAAAAGHHAVEAVTLFLEGSHQRSVERA